jgi:uncharacterized DUF497 family protein
MLHFESLEIDDHILEKIVNKHCIDIDEVEEICISNKNHVRKTRDGLYKVFGQTDSGRYILAVLVNHGSGHWKVATARDMTTNEKQQYKKKGK